MSEIHETLFTRSTAVSHKYLNDELKILCLLQFFPAVAQNSLRIPCVFHVQRNPWVFQVFQVFLFCGHPVYRNTGTPHPDPEPDRHRILVIGPHPPFQKTSSKYVHNLLRYNTKCQFTPCMLTVKILKSDQQSTTESGPALTSNRLVLGPPHTRPKFYENHFITFGDK